MDHQEKKLVPESAQPLGDEEVAQASGGNGPYGDDEKRSYTCPKCNGVFYCTEWEYNQHMCRPQRNSQPYGYGK